MDNAKVKNHIILVLLLVNVFLLGIVLTNALQERRATAERKQALSDVLSQNGIRLADGVELTQSVPAQVTLRRDEARETQIVTALLGSAERSDLGGNVYVYTAGNGGEARFRGTGDFTVLLGGSGMSAGKSPVDTAAGLLQPMGLRADEKAVHTQGSGDNEDVTFSCVWSGSTVYNARVTFHFSAGRLCLITGTRLFDTQSARVSLDNCPDGITVLMNFLQSVRSTGDVCTEIRSLKLGYFMSSAVSGECTLRPVWCVETDSRAYYIDAETGKSETLDAAA